MGIAAWPPQSNCPVPGYEWLQLVYDGVTREGGQGAVFKAVEDNQTVAVKFLKDAAWGNRPVLEELFRQEARLGRDLRSEYLGHSYQILDLRGIRGWPSLAIVMEFFPLSLAKLLEDCAARGFQIPLHLVERWTRQLAEACRVLHAERYVHRDITPGNIMFRWPRGKTYGRPESLKHATAVLADLGVIVREGQEEYIPVRWNDWRDPLYFPADPGSSELVRPPAPAADIFALGKVFDTLAAHIDGPSDWLKRVAAKCQREPAERPTAVDLLEQLSANADERMANARLAGWRLGDHAHFVGREWAREERDGFIEQCEADGHGGIFLVVGPAGVGKSALLTNWAATGAPWPGYYFNCRETGVATAMPEHLHRQIKHQLTAGFEPPPGTWETKHLQAMLDDWSRNNPAGRLLIFIDALDEAKAGNDDAVPEQERTGPRLAAELIPKDPPRGVFLIVSSRPASTWQDHLGKLRCPHLKRLELLPEGEKNKEDVARYFRSRLEDYLEAPNQAEQLTEASGGIFRLAVLIAREIRSGKETVAGLLQRAAASWAQLPGADMLFGYYLDDLQRALGNPLEPYFHDFARLVVALQDWISEDEILRVLQHDPPRGLEWHEFRRDRLIRSLAWFLTSESRPRDGNEPTVCFWPQHASVRDFLVAGAPSFPGPARSGMREMHSRIGNCFRQLAEEVGWCEVPYYGRLYAARHLLQSGRKDDYRRAVEELLCNLDYLQATLGDNVAAHEGKRVGGDA